MSNVIHAAERFTQRAEEAQSKDVAHGYSMVERIGLGLRVALGLDAGGAPYEVRKRRAGRAGRSLLVASLALGAGLGYAVAKEGDAPAPAETCEFTPDTTTYLMRDGQGLANAIAAINNQQPYGACSEEAAQKIAELNPGLSVTAPGNEQVLYIPLGRTTSAPSR